MNQPFSPAMIDGAQNQQLPAQEQGQVSQRGWPDLPSPWAPWREDSCVHAKSLQLFPTLYWLQLARILCQRILQARILEWVAMPSSRGIFPTQRSNLLSLASPALVSLPLMPPGKPEKTQFHPIKSSPWRLSGPRWSLDRAPSNGRCISFLSGLHPWGRGSIVCPPTFPPSLL